MRLFVHISIVMAALSTASCSSDPDEELFSRELYPVPVRVAVSDVWEGTRAVVNSINDISVSSLGIYEVAEGDVAGTFPWTTSPLLNNVAPAGINGNELKFSPSLYYPGGGRKIIFYGYYPRTTATGGANYVTPPGNGTAPVFNFTLTGQEDIMYGASATGGSYSPGTAIPMVFKHKLTQIQLNISALGTLLSSVKMLNVRNTGALNLETGVVVYGSNTIDITLSKADLTTTVPVMVPADVPSYKVRVAFLGEIPTRTYVIKPTSGNFQAGVVYTIKL